MRFVYIMAHQCKPELRGIMRRVASALKANGISACAEPWLTEAMGGEAGEMFTAPNGARCDAIVALGGDGTLLRATAAAVEMGIPLLGVNIGTVGFLTMVELEQAEAAFARLSRGEYGLTTRMLLEAELNGRKWLALNDIVVSRGGYARLIGVNVKVDGEPVGRFIGDGLIVSTPTGSTGYSLSAGGPIVCPEVECLVLTPICAHSLQHRPVVASSTSKVVMELDDAHSPNALISVDGREACELGRDDRLAITRSERRVSFISIEPREFFSKIRYKLSEWSC